MKINKRNKHYSQKQLDKFACISNDISEDIDNGESREELRSMISYINNDNGLQFAYRKSAENNLQSANIIIKALYYNIDNLNKGKKIDPSYMSWFRKVIRLHGKLCKEKLI